MDARLAVPIAWGSAVTGPGLVVLAVQLTVIAALGLAALWLLRRASAAVRHLVAVVTMAAMIALPFVSAATPRLRLPLLPARTIVVPHRVARPAAGAADAQAGVHAAPVWLATGTTPVPASILPAGAPDTPDTPGTPVTWPVRIALIAAAIAAVLLARVAIGMAVVAWITARAEDVRDPAIREVFDEVCDRMGVHGAIRLAMSERVGVPAIAGVVRPTLVLPPDAASWDAGKLRVVFLHEMAHVLRGDGVGLLLARLTTALYWFHPLAWLLVRESRRDSERACDDVVLGCGERASEYAGHLLHIASAAGARDPLAGLTLAAARRSSLEGRLVAILRGDLRRDPVSRRTTAVTAMVAAMALLALASVRVVAAPARIVETPAPAAVDPAEPEAAPVSEVHATTMSRGTSTHTNVTSNTLTTTVSSNDGNGGDDWNAKDGASASEKRSGERWFSEARRYYKDDRYREAGDAYQRAADAGYRVPTALYNAACSFALAGDKVRALDALDRAVETGWDDRGMLASDSDLDAIRDEARFAAIVRKAAPDMVEERNRAELIARYDRMRTANEDDAGAWGSVAIRLMRAGAYPQAADAFSRQHRLSPDATAPLYNTACVWALANDRAKAFEALDQAIAAGYGDADHMADDDDLRSLHRDPRFDKALRLTRDLEIRYDGRDDEDQDAWRDELPRYERVARENGAMGRAWSNLGYARLRAGDASGSYTAYQRALELGYRKGTTSYNLACASAQLGRKDEAIQWLERAEAAGMTIGPSASNDRDLRPLRTDDRFWTLIDRSVETAVGKRIHSEKTKTSDTVRK
jgi:beta-lactamase regulating signal transducer with metallopeptidase domain/tetratricopeptide (TPR) repeat protein